MKLKMQGNFSFFVVSFFCYKIAFSPQLYCGHSALPLLTVKYDKLIKNTSTISQQLQYINPSSSQKKKKKDINPSSVNRIHFDSLLIRNTNPCITDT